MERWCSSRPRLFGGPAARILHTCKRTKSGEYSPMNILLTPSAPTVLKKMPCRASQTRRYVVDRWKVVSRGDAAAQAKQALKKLNTLTAWTNTSKQANRDTDEHLRVPSM